MSKKNVVLLQPRIRCCDPASDAGWIGGHAQLPAGFTYPTRNGIPYQFLLQIDCSRLPPTAWGGLGPREGWLAVFLSWAGDLLNIKVIHTAEAGVTSPHDEAWDVKSSSLCLFKERFHRFFQPPVAWPLVVADGASFPSPTRVRPKEDAFRLSDPANWPLDWETHLLLLEEIIRNLEERSERYADAARQRAASDSLPSDRLLALLREKKVIAERLINYFTNKSRRWAFKPRRWRSRRDELIHLRLLDDEWLMETNQGFYGAFGIVRIEKANNLGEWPSRAVPSPLFNPTSREGNRHARVFEQAKLLRAEMEATSNLPKEDLKRGGPDYSVWLKYREEYPEEWQHFKSRILEIRAEFYRFWLDNQTDVNRALGSWGQFPEPESWEDAIEKLSRTINWTDEALQKAEARANGSHHAFVEDRNSTAQRASAAAGSLIRELEQARQESKVSTYAPSEKSALFERVDEMSNAALLSDFWHVNFEVIRSEIGKRIFASNPALLPESVRERLAQRWQFDAEQATVQLGGRPRGYCHSFENGSGQSILLFQIPSNHLTSLTFGDVSDLVISISEQNLRAGRFDLARMDVSN